MTRRPIGLTAPYRPVIKTVLAPNAPWPKIEPVEPKKPKPKKRPAKPNATDQKFDAWLANSNKPKTNTKGSEKVAHKSEPA